MATHLTNSELTITLPSTHSNKAWHFLALLLSIGRPARLAELASKCTLFPSSPDYILFLCSVPNSPLFLTDDLFVTLSSIAFFAFGQYMSNSFSIAAFAPRFKIGCLGPKRLWDGIGRIRKRKCKVWGSNFMPVAKKRATLTCVDEDREDGTSLSSSSRIQNACIKVQFHMADDMSRCVNTQPGDISFMALDSRNLNKVNVMTPLLVNSNVRLLSYGFQNIKHVEGEKETSVPVHKKIHGGVCRRESQHSFLNIENVPDMPNPITLERLITCEPDPEINIRGRVNFNATSFREVDEQIDITPLEAENLNSGFKSTNVRTVEIERIMESREEELLFDLGALNREIENSVPAYDTDQLDMLPRNDSQRMNLVNCNDLIPHFEREPTTAHTDSQAIFPAELSVAQKQLKRSSPKRKTVPEEALTPIIQALCQSVEDYNVLKAPEELEKCKRDHKSISKKPKLKHNHHDTHIGDQRETYVSIPPKNQLEPKVLPKFESFIVEEEEGSGGYGTVYRARRKNDGITLAIKCPHANAHRQHVNNELRMLERFGGKNFVIKYEGSFKCGNSECFVLEHVEHDRPEVVLKREIDIFQLQWYGYCMFRALASLHKQGIVHRDVKPGNFLFSRKVNKGYLIDFNLAMVSYTSLDKSKAFYDLSFDHIPLPHAKFVPPTKSRKFMSTKFSEAANREAVRGSKLNLEPKNLKKAMNQTKAYVELGSCMIKSQGGDGSGITSAKDVTSTRTPSVERLREPLPCQGRKELISLVQEAMQTPNDEAMSVPVPKRKRVAAPSGKVDRKLVYLTPMPLNSTGIAVAGAGAGLLKNKGDGKSKREGPCVGTKGFRAPEVLFRSPHQGPKVDIWSAGVTLLYLIIGRMPFVGDPEQNIKDIAKLRGSEDLWEVAKLHNRESSFPTDLFDVQSLPSTKLWAWCKENTKRPEFLKEIPRSLFDLVDKCLMVNPRLRISAEEALRHEFFAPCHEGLRRQRLLRQGLSLEAGTSQLLPEQNIIRAVQLSH
ncbi:hypothetical protein L1049_022634 [Liquidambar formosana]|uniref:non-specific serine/threonine protein kinase n=1 Tax=Liquidambar formosana TaxID=63359 RepID=A0AAP0RCR5_LIQFO